MPEVFLLGQVCISWPLGWVHSQGGARCIQICGTQLRLRLGTSPWSQLHLFYLQFTTTLNLGWRLQNEPFHQAQLHFLLLFVCAPQHLYPYLCIWPSTLSGWSLITQLTSCKRNVTTHLSLSLWTRYHMTYDQIFMSFLKLHINSPPFKSFSILMLTANTHTSYYSRSVSL